MKTHVVTALHFATRNLALALASLLVLTVPFSSPAHAQKTWQLDPQLSVARLSAGSGSNPMETGLARVTGDVVFDSNDLTNPSVNLKITPGNEARGDAKMTFASRRAVVRSNGNLIVTGVLSVTRTERSVTADPNEAYAGPQYGELTAPTDTRQITFVFADPHPFAAQDGTVLLAGTTSVIRENFPLLVDALTLDKWPSVLVNDKQCEVPPSVGEDYAGVKCSETEIAAVSNTEVQSAVGEAYQGFELAVAPDRKQTTITLKLKLIPAAPSVVSKSESAGHQTNAFAR